MSDFDKWNDDLIKSLHDEDDVPLASYITLDEADAMWGGSEDVKVPFYIDSLGHLLKQEETHKPGGQISMLLSYTMDVDNFDATALYDTILRQDKIIFAGKDWVIHQAQIYCEMDHTQVDVELRRYVTEEEYYDRL